MGSAGISCIKCLLFCFNLLFALSGIAVLTIGAIIHIVYSHYSSFVYPSYQSAPLVLIGVGVVIFVIAFFGCCGAVKESYCMIITFSSLLIILLIIELIAGVIGYIKRDEVKDMLEHNLNTTMNRYYTNPEIKDTWDIAQHEFECCGISGPSDWRRVTKNDSLPHTCCPGASDNDACTVNTENVYEDSCVDKLVAFFKKYGSIFGFVGLGILGTQIFGVLFAFCLACSIRREYQVV